MIAANTKVLSSMLVTRGSFHIILALLDQHTNLSVDTETTGLRMFHGDRIFSIIIASSEGSYYFNFNPFNYTHVGGYELRNELPIEQVLDETHLRDLQVLFSRSHITWDIANAANFDLPIMSMDKIEVLGVVHCTKAIGRVVYNDYRTFSLEDQLERIGRHKDDRVMAYIKEHKLWTELPKPNGDTYKQLHFDKVPFEIIMPYGCTDGSETLFLGNYQREKIKEQDLAEPNLKPGRSLEAVMHNERRLQKTIFRMKKRGVLIDRPYVERAIKYEKDREQKSQEAFKKETGHDYLASGKLFQKIFESEKEKWGYTAKGNPSFDADSFAKFTNPAAKEILAIRDAKSKRDFYDGFLWQSDSNGRVHPNFNPEGVAHGRFSSSEPNFQNLTSEELLFCKKCGHGHEDIVEVCEADGCGSTDLDSPEFLVRRAIIPPPGHILIMPDYDQMEYKFMLELACIMQGGISPLGELIINGMDFHKATQANVQRVAGIQLPRKQIKIVNFMKVYGAGVGAMADAMKVSFGEAQKIGNAIMNASPEIQRFIDACANAAKQRGYVINHMGRRSHFPNKRFSYRAANYIVSGGCADVNKKALNEIDEFTLDLSSGLTMTVHDENVLEVPEDEIDKVPRQIKFIMENTYQSKYIPLTCGFEWSAKSLADKVKGLPR